MPTINNFYEFSSWESELNVTILAWVHGNEASWISATKRLIYEFENKIIPVLQWNIRIISGVNERAIDANVRWIREDGVLLDMNRFFQEQPAKTSGYEYDRSREIMLILQTSHYLLDLHSTSGPSLPYFFAENQSAEFAETLGISHIVSGWMDICDWNGNQWERSPLAGDTESYATKYGARAMTLEAWDHLAPDAEKTAYQVALNLLSKIACIWPQYFQSLSLQSQRIRMDRVYVGRNPVFTYAFPIISNFMELSSWQLIGYDGNLPIYAYEDSILVMPAIDTDVSDVLTQAQWINIFQIGKIIS